ncbi:MAG TPA: hypothetical protein CFH84_05105 [Sulfurimonas sp. UBA12504]|nr:MAG: hypothetical protein A2019_01365 [Sulfurimonas sp. GWF2_37_8]DAB30226.1 MAG TPA: hypothetical protein CFH84_05105 [Sulfurimonas sp. UBA12504]
MKFIVHLLLLLCELKERIEYELLFGFLNSLFDTFVYYQPGVCLAINTTLASDYWRQNDEKDLDAIFGNIEPYGRRKYEYI